MASNTSNSAGGAATLCSECARLQLQLSDFDDLKGSETRQLFRRTLYELKRRSCSICRVVAFAVDDTRADWQRDRHEPDQEVNVTATLELYRMFTSKPFRVIDIMTQFPFHGPSYGMQLFPVQGSTQHKSLLGRVISEDSVSRELVRSWMSICANSHGEACAEEKTLGFDDIMPDLLLIDVAENCIIVAPTRDVRYVALSYVWGDQPDSSATNTKDTNAALAQPNGLLSFRHTLPAVIKDAISLTSSIRERYLWVDRLCIVQDDEVMKERIINKMNVVYQNAVLTFIAASGSDADAGLPGVNSSSRKFEQPKAVFSDDLTLIYPQSHRSLRNTAWASRGWTFQEYYFAKRKLIFHNGIVYFKCRSATFREDLVLETFPPIEAFNMDVGYMAREETWELPSTTPDDFLETRRHYGHNVQAYRNRHLRYSSDTLAAFAGVLDEFSSKRGVEFHRGIPTNTMGMDLFWQAETFVQRTRDFPSWSWAGWKGRIWIPIPSGNSSDADQYTMSSWISYYKWNFNEKAFTCLYSEGLPQRSRTGSRDSPVRIQPKDAFLQLAKSSASMLEDQEDEIEDAQPDATNLACLDALVQASSALFTMLSETTTVMDHQLSVQVPLPNLLLFRTFVSELWISGLAPNSTLSWPRAAPAWVHQVLRPALWLYAKDQDTSPAGIVWLNSLTDYIGITALTATACPSIALETWLPTTARMPIADVIQEIRTAIDRNDTEGENLITDLKDSFKLDRTPMSSFRLNSWTAMKASAGRCIARVKLAILSGPVRGDYRSRAGINGGPSVSNYGSKFIRALVLDDSDRESKWLDDGLLHIWAEQLGTAELELNSVCKFDDLALENIVMH